VYIKDEVGVIVETIGADSLTVYTFSWRNSISAAADTTIYFKIKALTATKEYLSETPLGALLRDNPCRPTETEPIHL
jgi:hypothetical protein